MFGKEWMRYEKTLVGGQPVANRVLKKEEKFGGLKLRTKISKKF